MGGSRQIREILSGMKNLTVSDNGFSIKSALTEEDVDRLSVVAEELTAE